MEISTSCKISSISSGPRNRLWLWIIPAKARGDVAQKAFIGARVAGLRGLHEPFEGWIIRLLGHASVAIPVKETIPEQFAPESKVFVFATI